MRCAYYVDMGRGSLFDVLHSENPKYKASLQQLSSSWALRKKLMLDVAQGVLYLHSHDPIVIHRDLKVFLFHQLIFDSLIMYCWMKNGMQNVSDTQIFQ